MTAYPITVCYVASCPLCCAEIETMKSRDVRERMRLVDCSAIDFVEPEGVSRDLLMSRIHARDANGAWLRGVDVFAAVYEAAGFPRIARVCRSACCARCSTACIPGSRTIVGYCPRSGSRACSILREGPRVRPAPGYKMPPVAFAACAA